MLFRSAAATDAFGLYAEHASGNGELTHEPPGHSGALRRAYVRRNAPEADRIRLAEADIELDLGDGVTVNGRIDLVRTVEADGAEHTAIVDLKTGAKDASECLNAEQLRIYALGYRALTGEAAQQLQIYHLDESQVRAEPVTEAIDRKSTRLNSSHPTTSRMPSSA